MLMFPDFSMIFIKTCSSFRWVRKSAWIEFRLIGTLCFIGLFVHGFHFSSASRRVSVPDGQWCFSSLNQVAAEHVDLRSNSGSD
jgi:hypothetical protein